MRNVTVRFKPGECMRKMFSSVLCPVQTLDATLLANYSQHCWMLHVESVCTPCCMLLDVVAQSLKPVEPFSQQLPTFLLFRDRRSVAQQCWSRLHSSSNIVGVYARSLRMDFKDLWLVFFPRCTAGPNIVGSQHCWRNNVGSCCARLHAALLYDNFKILF